MAETEAKERVFQTIMNLELAKISLSLAARNLSRVQGFMADWSQLSEMSAQVAAMHSEIQTRYMKEHLRMDMFSQVAGDD